MIIEFMFIYGMSISTKIIRNIFIPISCGSTFIRHIRFPARSLTYNANRRQSPVKRGADNTPSQSARAQTGFRQGKCREIKVSIPPAAIETVLPVYCSQ